MYKRPRQNVFLLLLLALFCLPVLTGQTQAAKRATSISGIDGILPLGVNLVSLDDYVEFFPSDSYGTLTFEVVSGGDLLAIDGYDGVIRRPPQDESTVVIRATLNEDPGVSAIFKLSMVPADKKVTVRYYGSPMSSSRLSRSFLPATSGKWSGVIAEEGGAYFYPATSQGTINFSRKIPRAANGDPVLSGELYPTQYETSNGFSNLELGKTYDLVAFNSLQYYSREDHSVQIGDRMYLEGGYDFSISAAYRLLGGCSGENGFCGALRDALAEFAGVSPEEEDALGCYDLSVQIPMGTWAATDPGGTYNFLEHMDPSYQKCTILAFGSECYKNYSYRTPLAQPALSGTVSVSDPGRDFILPVSNLSSYSSGVSFCLAREKADPGELVSSGVALEKTASGLRIPASSLMPGRTYRLYAKSGERCFSLPAAASITVPGSPAVVLATPDGVFTSGSAGSVTLTLPEKVSGSYTVTISGVLPAEPPTSNTTSDTEWKGIKAKAYGSCNGETISSGSASTTLSFTNGTARLPLILGKSGLHRIKVEVGGVGTGVLEADVVPGKAIGINIPYSMQLYSDDLGGGLLHDQPSYQLLDSYGNPAVNDNTTQVLAKLDGSFHSDTMKLTGTTAVTAKNGVIQFTDLCFTTTRQGFDDGGNSDSTVIYISMDGFSFNVPVSARLLPYEGVSIRGEKLYGSHVPSIAGIERIDGDDTHDYGYFRVKLANAENWPVACFAGGNYNKVPQSKEHLINLGSGLNNHDGYWTKEVDTGPGHANTAFLISGGARLYFASPGDQPYWGYLDIVSEAMDVSGVTCTSVPGSGKATISGLTPGTWYVVGGSHYISPTSYESFNAQDLLAGADGTAELTLRGDLDGKLLELEDMELYIQEVRETSFSERALLARTPYTLDPPLPGMDVRFREPESAGNTVSATLDFFHVMEPTYNNAVCAAYTSSGRFLGLRTVPVLVRPVQSSSGVIEYYTQVVDFDFSGLEDVDHYKLFCLDPNWTAPASGSASMRK